MCSEKFLASDVIAINLMLTRLLLLFSIFTHILGFKYVRFIIFKISLVNPLTFMRVWLSFPTEKAPFAALRITFYVTHG